MLAVLLETVSIARCKGAGVVFTADLCERVRQCVIKLSNRVCFKKPGVYCFASYKLVTNPTK